MRNFVGIVILKRFRGIFIGRGDSRLGNSRETWQSPSKEKIILTVIRIQTTFLLVYLSDGF
ncbi:hypothetical protein BES34_015405 [Leptospira inadai serovar Lyme]|uniref:Uncharacterized protein n=1 Tax=Leptospira inadai serovar Lyme TaxID=293084 RepID=A0ABX4YFP2_9LEPT|nr:hypothetical protein BES34_015405 [Leptospira inadai serovar Lyme]